MTGRSLYVRKQSRVRAGERSLHFAPDLHGRVARIVFHVRPLESLTFGHVPAEFDVLGKAERVELRREGDIRGRLPAPHAEAALEG